MKVIQFKEGSIAYNIIFILGLCIEYPVYSLKLLGSEVQYKRVMKEMTEKVTYINYETKERIEVKALNITGKGKRKSVHLGRGGEKLLEWVGLKEYYEENYYRISTEEGIDRAHRVAETVGFFFKQGVIKREDYERIRIEKTEELKYYPAKRVLSKDVNYTTEIRKNNNKSISFTRIIGVVGNEKVFYPVYNIKDKAMKWAGASEYKVKASLAQLSLKMCGNDNVNSIIMLGKDYDDGMKTVENCYDEYAAKNSVARNKYKMTNVFQNIHFVPLNEFGHKLMKLLEIPDVSYKIREAIYGTGELNDKRNFDYDRKEEGKYLFNFLDSDIGRLQRFYNAKGLYDRKGVIYCYPEQLDIIKTLYNSGEIEIMTVSIDDLIEAIS